MFQSFTFKTCFPKTTFMLISDVWCQIVPFVAVIGVYLGPPTLLLRSVKPDLNFRINKTVRTEEKSKRRRDAVIIPDVV